MVIIGIAAVLLEFLLFFEKGKNRKGIVPTKTVLSALFVGVVGKSVTGHFRLETVPQQQQSNNLLHRRY